MVAGASLAVVLARLLDTSSYGLLFFALSIFSIAKLFSAFGLAKAAGRFISEYKETDPGQIPHILRITFLLNLVTIGVVVSVFILGQNLIISSLGEPKLSPFLLLGSVFIVLSTIQIFIRFTLQGFENIKAASAVSALHKISQFGFAIGFVLLSYGALGALAGYITSLVLVVIVGGGYLIQYEYRQLEKSQIESGLQRRIAEYSIPIAITQSAHTVDHHLDKILVGFFIGPAGVAFYTVGKQVIQIVVTPVSALGFTLSPTYGSQKAQGNNETAAQIYETALSHGLLLYIPAAAGMIILAEPGLRFVFGQEYIGAVPVLQVLSIFAVLQAVTKLTSNALDYLGRARERAIAKSTTAILNVILNIILIPRIGVVGAAAATVITFTIYTFINMYIMYHELAIQIAPILKQLGYVLGITFVMTLGILPLVEYITSPITLFVVVFIGILIWAGGVLAFGLIDVEKIVS